MRRVLAPVALVAGGGALAAASVAAGTEHPGWWFAGESSGAAALELVAGVALVVTGAVVLYERRRTLSGPLLAAAGYAWFAPEWTAPEAGGALSFSLALVFVAACPPLVAHALIGHSGNRRWSWARAGVTGLGYLSGIVLVGLVPTTLFDPRAAGCSDCPANLLLVDGSTRTADSIARAGLLASAVWAALAIALMLAIALRSSPARRRLELPVLVPAAVYLAAVGTMFAHSVDRAYLGNDSLDSLLWHVQAGALCLLSAGTRWEWLRARRTRAALARLVVEVEREPAGDGLRAALARSLGDPSLELVYTRTGGELVDPLGRTVRPRGDRELTPLVAGGRELGVLSHRPGSFDDPMLASEVVAAAGLALDNERLQAELRAQLEELRASRARIVSTGDAERRRLERDLHDGAQQRLVSLMLSIGLVRAQLAEDPELAARLEEAQGEVRELLAALRELAHGLYPAVLADEGLAAAVEALAEGLPGVEIGYLPQDRLGRAVETAAYLVIYAGLTGADGRRARVSTIRHDRSLLVAVAVAGGDVPAPGALVQLEDRVGAVGGRLTLERVAGGESRLTAELPCG